MSERQTSEVTQILQDWNNGDADAGERLLPIVYNELKRNARFLMAKERADHTLQPTALVHEAFLKLTELTEIKWKNRRHFYHFVSKLMRQILVDHVRHHTAAKRGSTAIHFSISDLQIPAKERADSILKLDEALDRLTQFDEKQAKIVEMRYFGGMKNTEIAEALDNQRKNRRPRMAIGTNLALPRTQSAVTEKNLSQNLSCFDSRIRYLN